MVALIYELYLDMSPPFNTLLLTKMQDKISFG